jgi:hypothetical protein
MGCGYRSGFCRKPRFCHRTKDQIRRDQAFYDERLSHIPQQIDLPVQSSAWPAETIAMGTFSNTKGLSG